MAGKAHIRIGVDKTSPDYNPYGTVYSERQISILNGALSLDAVRLTEIAILRKKAEKLGDMANAEIADQLYAQKSDPDAYFPPYTLEEAQAILKELTPWETA